MNFIQEPQERIYSQQGSDVAFKWVYAKIKETVQLKSIIWSVENKTDCGTFQWNRYSQSSNTKSLPQ